jgi:NAD(P)-dependent dehydrogenase (short-subunit alcohol dehydrogenase family)
VRTGFIAPPLAKPKLISAIDAATPMGRLVGSEEVAEVILFRASLEAAFLSHL